MISKNIVINKNIFLSILWVFVMLNMMKADILSLYIPNSADELLKAAGDTPIPLLMLFGSIMMEISLLMIVLSYVLKRQLNRLLNIIISIITIIFIWGGMSAYPHYIFIACIETIALVSIFWTALKWSESAIIEK